MILFHAQEFKQHEAKFGSVILKKFQKNHLAELKSIVGVVVCPNCRKVMKAMSGHKCPGVREAERFLVDTLSAESSWLCHCPCSTRPVCTRP